MLWVQHIFNAENSYSLTILTNFKTDHFNSSFSNVNKKLFSAFHVNIRSMKNKRDEVDLLLGSLSVEFDVMLFSETWFGTDSDVCSFDNYVYNGLSRPHGRGGGLAVYVKKCHSHSVIGDVTITNSNVECLAISLKNIIVVATDPLRVTNHNSSIFWKASSFSSTPLSYPSF